MSQRWATHRAPTYEPAKGGTVTRNVVFCNTEYFKYPTLKDPYGECTRHGGRTSYTRCLDCADNDGELAIKYPAIPGPVKEACAFLDLRYDARRAQCRNCVQKTECLSLALTKKYRLKVIR